MPDFDSISNRGEYLSAHYFAEQLGTDLRKGIFDKWQVRENDELDQTPTARGRVRELRGRYLAPDARRFFAQAAESESDDGTRLRTHDNPRWREVLLAWHHDVLDALGFPGEDSALTVRRAGQEATVVVAWQGDGIVAVHCGWTAENDSALDARGAGRLIYPVQLSASERYETGQDLATWLFQGEDPPRFVLLLCGGVLVLADRNAWTEGRHLSVSLDAALERNDRRQTGELATIAALFSRDMLAPAKDATTPLLDSLTKASTANAVGVSKDLRVGLQRSVEIIANEVLARLAEAGASPAELETSSMPIARELTRESLRYLYRILFLLYAEARPELGILPADDGGYEAGYSVARLRELVARDERLIEPTAQNGFHLFESLSVLFDKVNSGHRPFGTEPDDPRPEDDEATLAAKNARRGEDRGLRFEPLRSELFEQRAIRLIGADVEGPNERRLDLRLRNSALHEVLRLLTMKKSSRRGERGGFISYRNLGINQLGAVYEGLMSYTGIIADQELCEVAKGGDPEKGSWLIPAHRQTEYPENTLVTYDEHDNHKGLRGPKRYARGMFVYRLAGRDRETSASYYTPESLTKVTVELTLKHRLDQETDAAGDTIRTRASELLRYKICEPALGSGAFLNEAINQVAEEYLRRRQEELGVSIPTSEALTEKQKAKAYIALHNAYGVDLNATGVELAEVSLWLNTMHPGMRAPWFGLHLRRGNSLIGARRAVYSGDDVENSKEWRLAKGGQPPTPLPFRREGEPQELPKDAVHQFLLPNAGWASVAGAKEAKELAPDECVRLRKWRAGLLTKPKKPQAKRLRDAARRVEFLWALVVKRMAISERAIARRIDVWGADPTDPEYGFLYHPEHPESKEKVFEDLFLAVDTPYWRLKAIMDAWCALWFWPVDQVGLLDGTDPHYTETDLDDITSLLPSVTTPPRGKLLVEDYVLFDVGGTQPGLELETDEFTTETREIPAKKQTDRKPTPKRRKTIPLKDLDDWLDFLEAMLGVHDVPKDALISDFDSLDQLKTYEDQLPSNMGMDTSNPEQRFPWLHTVRDIATDQGFLHWELDFALTFATNGGFDLQIGNPPWVRPIWMENSILAEHDPWFMLTERPDAAEKTQRRKQALAEEHVRHYVLDAMNSVIGTAYYLISPQTYPLISGSQPDFYRAFMCQTWDHTSELGCTGLIHPDTHFNGQQEARLRAASYRRLRIHGDFVNAGNRFFPPPVGRSSHFGIHIYGAPREINFHHLSWLFSTEAFLLSEKHNDEEHPPGVRYQGKWDDRPHRSRMIKVTADKLRLWQQLTDDPDRPVEHGHLLSLVSKQEEPAIDAFARYPYTLKNFQPQISSGFHESGAKKPLWGPERDEPLIGYRNRDDLDVSSWSEVILRGPQIGVANPLFKQPGQGAGEVHGLDLQRISPSEIPQSEYARIAKHETYTLAQDRWTDHELQEALQRSEEHRETVRSIIAHTNEIPTDEISDESVELYSQDLHIRPCSKFYRLAWRRKIAPDTERALFAAVFPPGPCHIHMVHSLAMSTSLQTTLVAGFWSSLPIDYYLRITGRNDLQMSNAFHIPSPQEDHPLQARLLLRILRLNCLTDAYANLWNSLTHFLNPLEDWALWWPNLRPLNEVASEWNFDTPLRSERSRRAALVEIDALVAVWLGINADTLIAMYRSRFPIMQDFDRVTWFDVNERKIAGDRYTYGHGQTKEHWEQFQKYLEDPEKNPVPEGYTAPFYKADREREMREAHAVFQARLDAAVARGEWDPIKQEVPGA